MKDKKIKLKIKNGKIDEFIIFGIGDNGDSYGIQPITLKEIAIINELLKKEQEKIMNKQKDEANKLQVSGSLKLGGVTELNLVQKHVNKSPEKGINIIYNPNIYKDKLRVIDSEGNVGSIKIDWE